VSNVISPIEGLELYFTAADFERARTAFDRAETAFKHIPKYLYLKPGDALLRYFISNASRSNLANGEI
jgi:hypothetical protein